MKRNATAMLFMITLLLIAVFVAGVRYGGYVEKINKANSFILSITPYPSPTAAPTKPLILSTFSGTTCGVRFAYPNSLTVDQESSSAAQITDGSRLMIGISCGLDSFPEVQHKKTTAVKVMNPAISAQSISRPNDHLIVFPVSNTRNRKKITIMVSDHLLPLIENSLSYE